MTERTRAVNPRPRQLRRYEVDTAAGVLAGWFESEAEAIRVLNRAAGEVD